MAVFVKELIKSINLIKKCWKTIPVIVLFDFLFLFCFGIISNIFQNIISQPLVSIVEAAAKLGNDLALALGEGSSAWNILFSDSIIKSNLGSILGTSLLFVVSAYLLWILFNSIAWYYSNKIISKIKFKKYLEEFSFTSLKWFLILIVSFAILAFIILIILLRPERILTSAQLLTISQIINFILLYFMIIGIAFVPNSSIKKAFSIGIKKILTFIAVFGIIGLVLYITAKLPYLILQSVIGLMVLAWARIYLILVAKKY